MITELSERIETLKSPEEVLEVAVQQFGQLGPLGMDLKPEGVLEIRQLVRSFGSSYHQDRITLSVSRAESGVLVSAKIRYTTSAAFWIAFLLLGLFTIIGWAVPLIYYFYHQGTAERLIRGALQNLSNAVRSGPSTTWPTPLSEADQLEKLAALRSSGVLTEQEFALAKERLLERGS